MIMEYSCISDDPDVASFEVKLKEKFYELQIKRNNLVDARAKIHEAFLNKHNLEQSLEKATRENEEIKIQLEVAINAARRGESERASNREILARQTVQLEALVKERSLLQDQIRKVQLENSDLQHRLEQAEEKAKSHYHLQETCKIKETQWRAYLDSLQSQMKALEQAHSTLKEMASKAFIVSRKAVFQLTHEQNVVKEVREENNKLHDQILSLSGELERIKLEGKFSEKINNDSKNLYIEEWENAQREMESKAVEYEKEILHLQESLNASLSIVSQLQQSESAKDLKIKSLTRDLIEYNDKRIQKADKSQQCDLEMPLE